MSKIAIEGVPMVLIVGHERIAYRLYRSNRRTLGISVAAGGLVEVRAPSAPSIDRIEQRLRARAAWIQRKVAEKAAVRGCDLPRVFAPGESHRYLGRQYRLRLVVGDRVRVNTEGDRLVAQVPEPQDRELIARALRRWLQQRARTVLPERAAWLMAQPAFVGLRTAKVRVQSMRTRWGSCSANGRVLLNSQLVTLPTSLIDYVIAHELCHLRVPEHGDEFVQLMSRVMPDWRARHRRLQQLEGI